LRTTGVFVVVAAVIAIVFTTGKNLLGAASAKTLVSTRNYYVIRLVFQANDAYPGSLVGIMGLKQLCRDFPGGNELGVIVVVVAVAILLFRCRIGIHTNGIAIITAITIVVVDPGIHLEEFQDFLSERVIPSVIDPCQLDRCESHVVFVVNAPGVRHNEGPHHSGRSLSTVTGQVKGEVPTGISLHCPVLALGGLQSPEYRGPVSLQDPVVQFGLCEAHDDRRNSMRVSYVLKLILLVRTILLCI